MEKQTLRTADDTPRPYRLREEPEPHESTKKVVDEPIRPAAPAGE